MNCYIGIDPGKSGCLAILTANRKIYFHDFPKDGSMLDYYEEIDDRLETKNLNVIMAVLERVHAMPKQGVSSMFTFGANFGGWQTWLLMKKFPHVLVPPQTWMKGYVSKADGPNTKQCVAVACKKLYPDANLQGPKGGYKDGRADALMMAHYAMQYSSGYQTSKRRS